MTANMPDHGGARWVTSSYSAGDAQCVEVTIAPGRRLLRDSKLGDDSPVLAVGPQEWSAFTAAIKAETFDLEG